MNKRKGFTFIELIVVIVIIFLLLAVLMPHLGKNKPINARIICGTNLRGIGTAMTVYANDYDDNYPQLPGTGPWSKELGFAYDLKNPDFFPTGSQGNTGRTITASLYLLVREADVAPKSFICPAAEYFMREERADVKYTDFDGRNTNNFDITELLDFGPDPYQHVSYSMHNPYGKFPADAKRNAGFAIAADMNPWFKNGDIVSPAVNKKVPQIIQLNDKSTWILGNSANHPKKRNIEGQNVIWADGHSTFETLPNTGINQDNIFTFHSTDKDPTEQDIQGGTNPTSRDPENDAKDKDDSFLAI